MGREQTPPLPFVVATHMLDWLDELGWSGSTGMGPAPLSFQEIEAWSRLTKTPLEPWEALALRTASAAYVGQLGAGDLPAPYAHPQLRVQPGRSGFAAQAKSINQRKAKS